MSKLVRVAIRLFALAGLAALCVWTAAGEPPAGSAKNSASLIGYQVPGDEPVFALSLKAGALPKASAHDIVVLMDTSASQAGAYREQGLKTLEAFLDALAPADRVRLFAADIQTKPLTEVFVAPRSAQIEKALTTLRRRVPLGATNLQGALESALESFRTTSGDNARSIVYIGDGMSTAKLVAWGGFQGLLNKLRDERIAVTSYAIGPRTDLQLLGILAEHTGGIVCVDALIDDKQMPAESMGQKLAQAADASVFYADQIRVSPDVEKLLPGTVPPIRSDRDTVLLGKGRVGEKLSVEATGEGHSLSWTVKPASAQAGNTFLAGLWSVAEQSNGLGVAVAGSELLNLARQEYEDQVQTMLDLGRRAVASRDLAQAEQIAHAVRQVDPANVEAQTILNAAQRVRAVRVPAPAGERLDASIRESSPKPPKGGTRAKLARLQKDKGPKPAPPPEEPPPAVGTDTVVPPPVIGPAATVRDEDLLSQERQLREIRAQRLRNIVTATIDTAQRNATHDIEASLGELKRALTTVIAATDIDPDVRESLRARVQDAIDRLQTAKSKYDMERIDLMQREAASRARELATEQLVGRDEQLAQMIEKVSSLMAEGYVGNADAFSRAEEVARASFELAPYTGVTNAAIFDSEAAGQLDQAQRLRYARYDKFLATLQEVERSHIPFPDEPPILYPAPEVWQALTERRQKWASVDLMRWNPTEDKIRRSLDKPTTVDFTETPLEDAIMFLKDYHDINVWIDRATLAEDGVALDTPVTLKLAGVSLRSVLKLLLEPSQLTYMIEDEVMKITTATAASDKLSVRVYPVGDLVVPIIQARMLMMMGGGMRGGMGMRGMGGMGGGMMGGMGGMGMGGMGMGMMNVASEIQWPAR